MERDAPLLRPFLKWAGNKYRLLARIKPQLPEGKRLIEPFVGSGAVFLNTDYSRYVLSDSNRDLIDLYRILQAEGREFIEYCRRLFKPANNLPDRYYTLRAEFNDCAEPRRRAAVFLYLNRHGYNGLCRYNARGGFNVPFGRYAHPYFPEKEMLAFHERSRRAVFNHADFTKAMSKARPGDVIYCDPPYAPLSPSANFTTYSAGGFTDADQLALVEAASKAAARGVPVLISNHDTHFTRQVYCGKIADDFPVQRYISCDGRARGKAGELLALFSP